MGALFERFTLDQIAAFIDYMEIGAYISRQRAALLQEHVLSGPVTPDQRIEEAKAFDAEAQKLADCIGEQIRRGTPPRNFADPAEKDE
jgi:hypothetical protein